MEPMPTLFIPYTLPIPYTLALHLLCYPIHTDEVMAVLATVLEWA